MKGKEPEQLSQVNFVNFNILGWCMVGHVLRGLPFILSSYNPGYRHLKYSENLEKYTYTSTNLWPTQLISSLIFELLICHCTRYTVSFSELPIYWGPRISPPSFLTQPLSHSSIYEGIWKSSWLEGCRERPSWRLSLVSFFKGLRKTGWPLQ